MGKKNLGMVGLSLSILLMVVSFCISVPERYIAPSFTLGEQGYYSYVNGDAYNYQIEASIRGGEIAGAKIQKAIYFNVSIIILFFSLKEFNDGDIGLMYKFLSNIKNVKEKHSIFLGVNTGESNVENE